MDMKSWQNTLKPYMEKSNSTAILQILNTLIPFFALWWLYIESIEHSILWAIPLSIITGLFLLRCFVLMHDCGHGSMFSSTRANQIMGYFLGAMTGMPQYVWSKHHAYHHATNGNFEKYRGPLSISSVDEYNTLNEKQKRFYWAYRHPAILPIAGFYYVLFNPRFTWTMGTCQWFKNIFASLFSSESTMTVIRECKSKYWKTPREYRHMTYNNLLLVPVWVIMCSWIGVFNFFLFYSLTLSMSGTIGMSLFIVQHNFENSYAVGTDDVDYCRAAIEGTSYLTLPAVLKWFTADISYHHIHHLSAAIPNYNLAKCHEDLKHHFDDVKRISLWEVPRALRYQLWDNRRKIIISQAEYQA